VSPVVHTENTIYPELRSSVHACKIAMAFVRLGLNGRSIMTGMGWVVWERSVQLYSIHVIDIMTTGSGKHAEPSRAGLDESIALSLLIWYGAIISL
jgi:hypothetical protein